MAEATLVPTSAAAPGPPPAAPATRVRNAELSQLLTDLRVLVVDTGRVWWRLLPQILGLYLLGWLAAEVVLRLSVLAGDYSAWLALGLFAISFVALLTSFVLILQVVGRELGIRSMIPGEEVADDGRDESVSQLLAQTLLPFLGIYAAFGQVTDVANRLVIEQYLRYGVFGSQDTVLGVLDRATMNHPWRTLALLAAVYLLRRGLDLLHEHTGRRALGLVVVFLESCFLLLVILGGIQLLQRALLWLSDRAFRGWISSLGSAITDLLAPLAIDLPAVLHRIAGFVTEHLWPVLWEVISQPIIWLAVAALIYGSQVLSLAELWRKGQTLADRIPGAGVFARHREKQAVRGPVVPSTRLGRVAREAQEAFFGDIDDKYLPTFHSLRLILRAGPVFLGSFVLAYGLLDAAERYANALLDRLIGGHDVTFWSIWGPWVDLVGELPFEPLRFCLLAVAFRRCLELFRQRSLVEEAP